MSARLAASLLAALVAGTGSPLIPWHPSPTAAAAQALRRAQPSTTVVLRGTIADYDTRSRTLSIRTTEGTVKLPLGQDVRIRQGWHHLETSTLKRLTGVRVAVRYFDSNGERVVESVHVLVKGGDRP
jgi:hypothetical protein